MFYVVQIFRPCLISFLDSLAFSIRKKGQVQTLINNAACVIINNNNNNENHVWCLIIIKN